MKNSPSLKARRDLPEGYACFWGFDIRKSARRCSFRSLVSSCWRGLVGILPPGPLLQPMSFIQH